ncbi:MAG: hypothetical protein HC882_00900 [Acidobacteria bacterium]|nr:hypothetical protein [Acidobacteriota bacterium]
MRCCVCGKRLIVDSVTTPFVRIYGFSRRVPVTPWEKTSWNGRENPGAPYDPHRLTIAELEGWTEETIRERGRPWLSHGLMQQYEDCQISFREHPIACATYDCTNRLFYVVERGDFGWKADSTSFTETTGSVIMRPSWP